MELMERASYVNERPRPRQKHREDANQKERRLYMLLLLSVGVLCITQAILNVSLRLTMYSSSRSPNCNTTHDGGNQKGEGEMDCEQGRNDFNRLQERFNALTRDKDLLRNKNNELDNSIKDQQNTIINQQNTIKDLQKELERLRMRPSEPGGCLSVSQCPAGWREIKSKCYYLSSDNEKKTWEDSRKFCQSKDADLVVVNSEEEQMDLYQLDGNNYLLFWIGLHKTGETFRWVDGSALTISFWQSGQPGDGGPNNTENCVEMYHQNPVLASWNDSRCGDKRRWLCEKAPSTC